MNKESSSHDEKGRQGGVAPKIKIMGATTDDGRRAVLRSDGRWSWDKVLSPVPAVASSQAASLHDFRRATWGMSRSQVRASEDGTEVPMSDPKSLAFETEMQIGQMVVFYHFADDTLAESVIVFLGEHLNENRYVADYNNVCEILETKYGKHKSDQSTWLNGLYRNDPEKYGFAISCGHLILRRNWRNDRTDITLGLTGDNFKIHHSACYRSIALATAYRDQKTRLSLDGF